MNKKLKNLSKFISLVLRHEPGIIGITLDSAGWANVNDLICGCNKNKNPLTSEILTEIVKTDEKGRYEFSSDGTKIRACQGHSVAVNLDYKATIPPEVLYHGSEVANIPSILKTGIDRRSRHHVHLSTDKDTAYKVGNRHGNPVVFEIYAHKMHMDGHTFYLSNNGVWLVDAVPSAYIKVAAICD